MQNSSTRISFEKIIASVNSIHFLTQLLVGSNGDPPNAIGANAAPTIKSIFRIINAPHTTKVLPSMTSAHNNIAADPNAPPVNVCAFTTLLPNSSHVDVPANACITPVLSESTIVSNVSMITKAANVPTIAIITPRTALPIPPTDPLNADRITCNKNIVTHTNTPISTVT
jgi:hypothetical protein